MLAIALSACSSGDPGPPQASLGTVVNRPLPSLIATLPLTNQHGASLDLASFTGKTTLVVPFLTLCTDICPLDTGNLLQVEEALQHARVVSKVQLVELSIDPVRDTSARLAAYARLTGARWQLLTETPTVASTIERYFGWVVQKVPEDNPPSIDWWTGKPLTYDINHTDGFVVFDAHGIERFTTGAAPDFHGSLNPTLHNFLTEEGRDHLAHPEKPGWVPADALQVLGWMLHRTIPPAG